VSSSSVVSLFEPTVVSAVDDDDAEEEDSTTPLFVFRRALFAITLLLLSLLSPGNESNPNPLREPNPLLVIPGGNSRFQSGGGFDTVGGVCDAVALALGSGDDEGRGFEEEEEDGVVFPFASWNNITSIDNRNSAAISIGRRMLVVLLRFL